MAPFGESGSWVYQRWGWLGLWAAAVVVLELAAIAGAALKLHPWEGIAPAAVTDYGGEHCEYVDTKGVFLQQANFWSNLAYLAAGLIIFLRSGAPLARGAGVALGILFVGSSLWHGTLTDLGRYLDIIGIYMALMAIGYYGVFEILELNQSGPNVRGWFWFVMALGVFAGFTKSVIPWHDSTWGAAILGTALFVFGAYGGYKYRKNWRRWLLPGTVAVLSFAWALFFKFADGRGHVLCRDGRVVFGPTSVVQGHALWHVLSAFMMLSLFEFYTSLRGKWRTVWPWRG